MSRILLIVGGRVLLVATDTGRAVAEADADSLVGPASTGV